MAVVRATVIHVSRPMRFSRSTVSGIARIEASRRMSVPDA